LILINYHKSDFGLSGSHDNVTSTACNHQFTAFFDHGNQRHVIDEVDIQKEGGFLIGKMPFHEKETAPE